MFEHELCISLAITGIIVTFILTHLFTSRAFRKEYTKAAVEIFNANDAYRRDFDARR